MDGDNGAGFMLEENRRRDMGRMLGWTDAEITSYWRSFQKPEQYLIPYNPYNQY